MFSAKGDDMGEALGRSDGLRGAIEAARGLVVEAIAQLDEAGAPADIAAHLDFALNRMASVIQAA